MHLPSTIVPAEGAEAGTVLGVETKTRKTEAGDIIRYQVVSLVTATGIKAFAVDELRDIQIKDKTAQVEMYNNYLTGKKGESYAFPVIPEIAAEYARLQNLARLRQLDTAVADAERRRRIYVLSSFKVEEGSDIKQVETNSMS